jgi:hypothetical protein
LPLDWTPAQYSDGIVDIASNVVEPDERPRVPLPFLCLLDTAEGTPGSEPRVFGRHPLPPELVFQQREMRRDLTREVWFGPSGAKGVGEP